ncbi:MAG: SurA N-terminal domain-containing protein [bacterium]
MSKKAKTKKVTKQTIITQDLPILPTPVTSPAKKLMNPKLLRAALILVLIALLTYKVGPWLVPSIVNNKLVTRFALWSRLEKTYGTQTLDDLVNEKILDGAIAKAGIKVEQKKIDDQIANLETQFKDAGGLDEALKQRGLTRSDLDKQVKTQLEVEELLADKITISDEEIQQNFSDNEKTLYADKKIEEVKATIITSLKETKLRDAFLSWFAEVKKTAKVKSFGL